MMKRQRRFLNVIAAVEGLRAAHPELRGPVGAAQLAPVFEREGIAVLRRPIKARAYTQGGDGSFVITLNSALHGRHHTRALLHEYAHIKLHRVEQGEFVRDLAPCTRDDPREYEAELFALLLRLGPIATPEHVDVARLVAKMEGLEYRRRAPAQLPLELPEGPVPEYRPLPQPFEAERQALRRPGPRGGRRIHRFVDDHPRSDDLDRILFFDPARGAARLTDVAGRLWWMYNYKIVIEGEKRRWELVRDFMSTDIEFRFFVNSLGRRQVYRFTNRREQRAYRVKHLDRQLAQSIYVPDRLAPRFPTDRIRRSAETLK